MRILMVSKALVVGMYQRKLEEMAALPDVQLTVAVPPFWREKGHDWRLERTFTKGYELTVLPMRLNGHYHVHYYAQLGRLLDRVRPQILHFDEEAYNLSTWLAMRAAHHRGIPFAFFNWQNIPRRYPPPFRWMEAQVFAHAALGITGNEDAGRIIRDKGYRGPIEVIPQFGIDPELFSPLSESLHSRQAGRPFSIGFVGRLIPAKGLGVLLEAAAGIKRPWRLQVVGSGPDREAFEARARELGIADRVEFVGQKGSVEMPAVMQTLDVLAGPSLTSPRWKEQFGRMLVEAMSCEVPVIGSDSGEIPQVIGDAGLIVPEGNVHALQCALERLQDDLELREKLGKAGRARVLAMFTQRAVAERTVAAYRAVVHNEH
jgi:glycosyltransferase involved in cell wall biosynthesis